MKIVLSICFVTSVAFSDGSEALFLEGNESYAKGKYEDAIQSYESILALGFESGDLYYNLGNAYYKQHSLGQAIWAYRNALKLKPMDPDAQYNLELANVRRVDRIEMPTSFFLLEEYRSLKKSLTIKEWILCGSILLTIQAILVFFMQFGWISGQFHQKLLTVIIVVILGVHGIAVDKYFQEKQTHEGVIIANGVDVYSGPYTTDNTVLFGINEGSIAEIQVHKIEGNWVEIILIDGKKGWVPAESIRGLK